MPPQPRWPSIHAKNTESRPRVPPGAAAAPAAGPGRVEQGRAGPGRVEQGLVGSSRAWQGREGPGRAGQGCPQLPLRSRDAPGASPGCQALPIRRDYVKGRDSDYACDRGGGGRGASSGAFHRVTCFWPRSSSGTELEYQRQKFTGINALGGEQLRVRGLRCVPAALT